MSYLEYQSCRLGHDVFCYDRSNYTRPKRDFVKSYLKPSFVGYRMLGEKYLATIFIFMYILFGTIDELVTSSACHAEGRRFESGCSDKSTFCKSELLSKDLSNYISLVGYL